MSALQPNGTLHGELSPVGQVSGGVNTFAEISGGLTIPTTASMIPAYDGSYEITPLPYTDTLMETNGKRMTDDVTVLAIPYYETTNESGGYTVNIG